MINQPKAYYSKEMKWRKQKPITGGRTAIKSECGLFCITKKDGMYRPLKLRGNTWKALAYDINNIDDAKKNN